MEQITKKDIKNMLGKIPTEPNFVITDEYHSIFVKKKGDDYVIAEVERNPEYNITGELQ